ncbi:HipA family kinase [Rufibacter soli]
MQKLDAISLEFPINSSESRTKPWVVTVLDENADLTSYVVKLFTREENDQRFAIAKELFANTIASQLGLSVPSPVLIDLYNDEFLDSLKEQSEDCFEILRSKDNRAFFGTTYLPGTPVNQMEPEDYVRLFSSYNLTGELFALDNLIHNNDRNEGKANIIRHQEKIYLLDHEYSLSITESIVSAYDEHSWVYEYVNHICFNCLKKTRRLHQHADFLVQFERRLQNFDTNLLLSQFNVLQSYGFQTPYEDFDMLVFYIDKIKTSSRTFVRLLKNALS